MTILLLALAAPLVLPASLPQSDWPHLRGPRLDGTTPGAPRGDVGLRVAWRKALGPAYSGVAVADGVALTTFSDGESDVVIALAARTGAERWRHALEPTYLGHDGSEDGPVASPVIGGGRAFVVSARGKLVALALADGKPAWTRDLAAELGTTVPEYGYGSTPLLEGGHLIVQAGGSDGRYLCALDPATGELVWSAGEGALEYGSPIAMDLAGRRQVVALAGKRILGVAPESGEILWDHALPGERDSAANGVATSMGDGERFFASVSGQIVVFAVERTDAGYAIEETVRIRELGRTYAAPVFAEGRLWGFKNEFLTCCDAETGARLWKSREPGGRGLVLVGDRLLVFGAQGVVALVDTDDTDYRELARCTALESASYVWPSFADGRAYLRNASELVCVELVESGAAAVAASASPAPPTSPTSPTSLGSADPFLALLGGIEDGDAAAKVAALLAEHETFPIVESGVVHFLWQGEAEDVAIAGSMLDGSKPDPLARVPGTDLWYRSYPIEPGARWEYRLQVDFGDWIADPRNPRSLPGASTPTVSEVVTGEYVERTHFLAPEPGDDAPRGRIEKVEFASAALGNTRELSVYLPAGYDEGDARYPLLLVHEGPDFLEKAGLAHTLDRLSGTSVRPLVAVFVAPMPEWWFEGGGTGTEAYVDALADELVPFLAERYRLTDDARERGLMGKESFGMTAVLGALQRPETFGKAGALSLSLGDRARHTIFALLEGEPRSELAFFVGWNRYEARNSDRGYDFGAESARTADALRAAGYTVAGGEALDSHGWGSWRARSAELLEALFPAE